MRVGTGRSPVPNPVCFHGRYVYVDNTFSGRRGHSGIPDPVRLIYIHSIRLSEDMPTTSLQFDGSEIGCKVTHAISTPCYRNKAGNNICCITLIVSMDFGD